MNMNEDTEQAIIEFAEMIERTVAVFHEACQSFTVLADIVEQAINRLGDMNIEMDIEEPPEI